MDAVGPIQNVRNVVNSSQIDVAEMQQQVRQDVQVRTVEAQTVMETVSSTIKLITNLHETQSETMTNAGQSAVAASRA